MSGCDQHRVNDLDLSDEIVFTSLYRENYIWVFNYLLSLCHNPLDAEDLTQEVFIKVVLHLKKTYQINNIQCWLRIIARNTFVDTLRKNRLHCLSMETMTFFPDPNNTFHEQINQSIYCYELAGAVDQVMRNQINKQIVFGVAQGKSYDQLANELNLSTRAVKIRLCRSRQFLKSTLHDW